MGGRAYRAQHIVPSGEEGHAWPTAPSHTHNGVRHASLPVWCAVCVRCVCCVSFRECCLYTHSLHVRCVMYTSIQCVYLSYRQGCLYTNIYEYMSVYVCRIHIPICTRLAAWWLTVIDVIDTPPCKIHTAYVWRTSQGGGRVCTTGSWAASDVCEWLSEYAHYFRVRHVRVRTPIIRPN